ncbi:MAG TPA: DUF3761 domain-containing protein [Pyrinomonadaceae bacterium]
MGLAAAPCATPLELTAAQHLAEAKRALADGYKPNSDPKKTAWGEVEAARWQLKSIAPAAPEYHEAQQLLQEVARRERQIKLVSEQAAAAARPPHESAALAETEEEDAGADTHSATAPGASAPAVRPDAPAGRAGREVAPTAPAAGGTSADYYTNVDGVKVRRPTFSSTVPEGATAQCRDGSYSFSRHRRGTCSYHGGVARWL